jgi:hypothetical protein
MNLTHEHGDPRTLVLLEENARFMKAETFDLLVKQIQRDGVLQQEPFVWLNPESGERSVLSGNHRVKAAIAAGLEDIGWIECDEPLTEDERIRIQLAHNSLVGEDDPTMLKRLYESIQDVDERQYTGLDDAALKLMAESSTQALSEANLDFTTLVFVFLPEEYDRAVQALADAKKLTSGDKAALVAMPQYQRTLEALEDARSAEGVLNAATGLGVLLDIWDRHREDLQGSWLASDGVPKRKAADPVPITSLFGMTMPAAAAVTVATAVRRAMEGGDVKNPWEILAAWAARSLEKTDE